MRIKMKEKSNKKYRKKKEEELRLQSEIIENMSEGVYLIKLDDGTIVLTNPAFEEMFGYNPGEMIGKNVAIVNAPTDKTPEETRETIMGILKDTGEWHGEVLNVKKDGTPFWCYANVSLFEHPEYGTVIISVHTDITERKKIELELKESEGKYKNLSNQLEIILDLIPGLLFCKDRNDIVTRVNQNFAEFLRMKKKDIIGKTSFDLFPEEQARKFREDDLEVINSGIPKLNIEESADTPGGKTWVITSKVPQFNEEGKTIGIIGLAIDITERREIEQKLEESEEILRASLESTADGILVVNEKGQVTHTNSKFANMWSIPQDLINTRDVQKLLDYLLIQLKEPEAFLSKVEQLYRSANEDFDTLYFKDGRIFKRFSSPLVLDAEIKGRVWSFRDITERKKAEEALREREERLRLIFEGSHDMISITDVNMKVLWANPARIKKFGPVSESEVDPIQRLHPDDLDRVMTAVSDLLKNKLERINFEYRFRMDSGEYRNFDTSVFKMQLGEDTRLCVIGHDVTESKHVEEKLREVNKLKSEFLRRASHELKTPLISIKGFSDLILSLYEDQLDTPIISKLREINDGCERLQNIINNLLKTSRLESPKLKPTVQKEDLSFLIKFCVHELQPLAERRKQSIELDIHNELYANIEKEEIHDVLSNLLTNAIKYTPPMGKIEIKTELKEDFVVVSVRDNGIGFTEEQKKKIFQQFGKIERYGRGLDLGIDGTGLGLYIAKRIVESHGGKIWMESEGKNKGASFHFTLPTAN